MMHDASTVTQPLAACRDTNLVFQPIAGMACDTRSQRCRSLVFETLEPRLALTSLVTINPSHPLGPISRDLIGTNVIYSNEPDAAWSDGQIAAALKALDTGFMRYPGGEVTSFYHWNKATGVPFVDSWNPDKPAESRDANRWMSFDEYIHQARLAGAKPLVGINIQSGHSFGRVAEGVAEAVALVRYAKNQGYGVKHYFIDNEQYAPNAQMTARQYADYVNLYSVAIRKVDPDLKIVANWQSMMNGGVKTILDVAGKNIDYIDMHTYWNDSQASFDNWRGNQPMTHAGETLVHKIQVFRQEIADRGLNIKLAVFEWNISHVARPADRPSPFQAAIMNSEMMMQFIRGGLDAAAFWPLHYAADSRWGESDRSLLTSDELQRSAIYEMLSLYKDLLGTEQVLTSTPHGSGVFATAGYDAQSDTTTAVLLKKTWGTDDLKISLGKFLQQPGSYVVEVQALRAKGAALSADEAELVSIPYQIDRLQGEIGLSLEGFALTKVTIKHVPALPVKLAPPSRTTELPPTVNELPPVVVAVASQPVIPAGIPSEVVFTVKPHRPTTPAVPPNLPAKVIQSDDRPEVFYVADFDGLDLADEDFAVAAADDDASLLALIVQDDLSQIDRQRRMLDLAVLLADSPYAE